MKRFAAAILCSPLLSLAAAPCVLIPTQAGLIPACFEVQVAAPMQVRVEQSEDITIRATGPGGAVTVDSFDFGPETITLIEPGRYRIEIHPGKRASVRFRRIGLAQARLLQEAERRTTLARSTGTAPVAQTAVDVWQASHERDGLRRATLLLGESLNRANLLSKAKVEFDKAYVMCQQDGDLRCAAEAANNSGLASINLGDLSTARGRLNEARKTLHSLRLPQLEAISLSNLGLLLRRSGDLQAAISVYDQARGLLPDPAALPYARILNNLALCYVSAGDYPKARHYLELALSVYGRKVSPRDAIRARSNLGRTYLLEGSFATALPLLQRAKAEAEQENDRSALSDVLLNLGQVELEMQRPTDAKMHLEQALAVSTNLGNLRDKASALHQLGRLARSQGDVSAARSRLVQASTIRRTLGLRDDQASSLFELASLDGDAAIARQALDLVESRRSRVPSAALRASYLAVKRRYVDLLVELASRHVTNPGEALLAAERGRARVLLDSLEQHDSAPNPALRQRSEALDLKIDLLTARLAGRPPDGDDLRRELDGLISEAREVDALLQQKGATTHVGQPVTSLRTLQAHIPQGSALLYYHLADLNSHAWLVGPENIIVVPLPSRAVIEQQANAVVHRLEQVSQRKSSAKSRQEFDNAVNQLSKTILTPLASLLPERVIIAPDGALNAVPFPLLAMPSGSRLGLERDLIQTPSASYLVFGNVPRAPLRFARSVLAVVDPVYSPSDARLGSAARPVPGAFLPRLVYSEEVAVIRALVPKDRRTELRGWHASISKVEATPLSQFGVLHFSAHAQADAQNPELTWLALSSVDSTGRLIPGLLRPKRFASWKLDGSTVVLSACETALGRNSSGEGFMGLASSLFQAGAGQLLLTQSKVDMEASSVFLADFYAHLFAATSQTVEHSLTLARRQLAGSRRWSDPFYWAQIIAVGRPSDRPSRPSRP